MLLIGRKQKFAVGVMVLFTGIITQVFGLFVLHTLHPEHPHSLTPTHAPQHSHLHTTTLTHTPSPNWGFFAHKRINRLAALTLPPGMMVFYKKHLDYITEHATDADARRYLVKNEGPKHFLDLDHFGTFPFSELPRKSADARMLFTHVYTIHGTDTVPVFTPQTLRYTLTPEGRLDSVWYHHIAFGKWNALSIPKLRSLYYGHLLRDQPEEPVVLQSDSIALLLSDLGISRSSATVLVDPSAYGEHGVLPWNLQTYYRRLVAAFSQQDAEQILKLSADVGHYVGDAHVPLHTVSNYNGQKTGQEGIHAFWESRIPELFADEEYDYFVGTPEYVANMDSFIWSMVLESHRHADTVLSVEKMLRISFPQREQMCADIRAGKQILTQCRNYARAYQNAMDGLVERRMRDAIHHLSCVWYSAWVDAGQPDLSKLADWSPDAAEQQAWKELQQAAQSGAKMIGRGED